MTAIADLTGGLVAHVKTDSGIAALVSTRVFGISLPETEAASMPRKCIVIREQPGGFPGATIKLQRPVIEFMCYGENAYEADKVRRTLRYLFRPLARVNVSGVFIHYLRDLGGPQFFVNGETDWPVIIERYAAMASESNS